MLARIPDVTRLNLMRISLLFLTMTALASCVTKEPPPLIADPNARETALPWNEQQKWERDGSAAGLNTAGRR
jgi:hypothetical protein